MVRARNWSEREFEILLNSYCLSDDDIAYKLPGRRHGAIEVVRAFIHNFHLGSNRDLSGLSQMMLRRLEEGRGSLICPKCGTKF